MLKIGKTYTIINYLMYTRKNNIFKVPDYKHTLILRFIILL